MSTKSDVLEALVNLITVAIACPEVPWLGLRPEDGNVSVTIGFTPLDKAPASGDIGGRQGASQPSVDEELPF